MINFVKASNVMCDFSDDAEGFCAKSTDYLLKMKDLNSDMMSGQMLLRKVLYLPNKCLVSVRFFSVHGM